MAPFSVQKKANPYARAEITHSDVQLTYLHPKYFSAWRLTTDVLCVCVECCAANTLSCREKLSASEEYTKKNQILVKDKF